MKQNNRVDECNLCKARENQINNEKEINMGLNQHIHDLKAEIKKMKSKLDDYERWGEL